eukprot:2026223-Lingulodinium_polyedra.AAC.1
MAPFCHVRRHMPAQRLLPPEDVGRQCDRLLQELQHEAREASVIDLALDVQNVELAPQVLNLHGQPRH